MLERLLGDTWQAGEAVVPLMRDAGLLDGLPVVEPAASAVAACLAAVEGLGARRALPPSFDVPTPWDVAVCCVLASCPADAAPLVIACLEAVSDPAFNLLAVQTTTSSAAPMFVVRGPIVDSLSLASGSDAMAGTAPANAAVGRAVRLVLRSIGGAHVGSTDMSTLGQPGKLTWCLAERSDHRWTMANDRAASTVMAIAAGGVLEVVLSSDSVNSALELLVHACNSLRMAGSSDRWGRGQLLVVLPPEVATSFADAGIDREQLIEVLHERAVVDRAQLAAPVADGVSAARSSGGRDPNAPVRISRAPSDVAVVVSGGTGTKAQIVPSWSTLSKIVRKPVAMTLRP